MHKLLASGPFLMILASGAFTTMTACTAIARGQMGGVDLVFWRALISLPLLVVVGRGATLAVRHERGAFFARALLGFAAMSSFYVAAGDVDLLTLALIMRLQPIIVTLAAPFVLGRSEYAGRSVIVAALVGFVGSALLLAPDLRAGSWSVLFAVAAPVFSGFAHLALRKTAPHNPGAAIVFWFHVVMVPLAVLTLGVEGRAVQAPPTGLLGPVIGIGAFAALGQLLMTRAYRVERAAVVATASYTGVLFSLVYDIWLFDRMPTLLVVPGGALVLGSSLYLVIRAQRRRALGLHT